MPRNELPDGDPDSADTSMGSLWRCDEPGNEKLVRFYNHEDFEDYQVEVHVLGEGGEPEFGYELWSDAQIEAFVDSEHTAFLSGHNFVGAGHYGVFVDGARPNCPECGAFMSPGSPEYHDDFTVGFTCKKYDRTNGVHEGYMTQADAIDKGYYIIIEDYLERRYGD